MLRYTDRAPSCCHRNPSLRRDLAGAGCPRITDTLARPAHSIRTLNCRSRCLTILDTFRLSMPWS